MTTAFKFNPFTGNFDIVTTSIAVPADTTTTFADGSIIFADALNLAEDNANLFWDNTKKGLGIGTNSINDGVVISTKQNITPPVLFSEYYANKSEQIVHVDASTTLSMGAFYSKTDILIDSGVSVGGGIFSNQSIINRTDPADEGTSGFLVGSYNSFSQGGGNPKLTPFYAGFATGSHSVTDGTVSSLYDFIALPSSLSGASVTDRYGIYLDIDSGYTKLNWLSGNTLLGGASFAAPTEALVVDGSVNLPNETADTALYLDASNNIKSVPAGTDGYVLTQVAGSPAWAPSSGGGGAGAYSVSGSCGAFSTGSGSPVDVTNLSVSLSTSGRPVVLALVADGNTTGGNEATIQVRRAVGNTAQGILYFLDGATIIGQSTYTVSDTGLVDVFEGVPGSVASHFYEASASSHTFKVQASVVGSTTAIDVSYIKLVAYEIAAGPSAVVPADSTVYMGPGNGHGSSGTTIRTFTAASTTGTDLTYTSDATDGDYVTVNATGRYSLMWYDRFSGGGTNLGFTVNQSTLTDDASAVPDSELIFYGTTSSTGGNVSATVFLTASDVVRFNDGGNCNNTVSSNKQAIIMRIG